MKRGFVVLAFVTALAAPALLLAHEGHAHHVMGTVNAMDANRLEVKDTTGKLVSCQLTADTKYLRGDTPVAAADVKVGERVMVEAVEQAGKRIAREVRLGKANT